MELSRDMYYPQPDVDSVVLKLTAKGAEKLFELEWLLNRAFAMRRKTLSNNLRAAGISDERLKSLLGACGIEGNIRAEKLTVAQFANIAQKDSIKQPQGCRNIGRTAEIAEIGRAHV